MRQDPIVIVPHDEAWAGSFREQADRLAPPLTGHLVVPIEHIGSTAVPGLPAKPIIDMLAVVDRFERVVPDVESIGWLSAPEPGDPEIRKRSLCFPTVAHRSHHLHVVEHGSGGWRDWLLFRDYLRARAPTRPSGTPRTSSPWPRPTTVTGRATAPARPR